MARCPYHDDNKASLSIKTGDKHDIVAWCHGPCGSVFDRLVADGYIESKGSTSQTKPPPPSWKPSKAEQQYEHFHDAYRILLAGVANPIVPKTYLASMH